ncbi:MAG: hypothetical protein ACK5RJ_05330 [Burkholderiales bacterium]|jgi:hypothetical protein|nr:hypothetical protein [Rhodocyclaceae bacterium]MCA3057287.1 hypothetical protein [Rhodocyclaceae bacterium]MCA3059905.1 hypothetical protein [Rhodocyclaceae bacterium]MCA3081461.1 hypothetical protein [Rhodocyclaceae bacterium]
MPFLDSMYATVSTNARGNLVVHVPRWMRAVMSAPFALVYAWVKLDFFEYSFESQLEWAPYIAGVVVVWAIAFFIITRFDPDLEFDNAKECVRLGSKVIAGYKHVRHVELKTNSDNDDGPIEVNLSLGGRNGYSVLVTNNETEASLLAADCARAMGKEVVLVDGVRQRP